MPDMDKERERALLRPEFQYDASSPRLSFEAKPVDRLQIFVPGKGYVDAESYKPFNL